MKRRVVPRAPPPAIDLKAVVARVPELRERLTQATELLNARLRACETALAELRLGVYAEVDLPYDRPGWTQSLVFAKEGQEWRLLVETGPTDGEVDVVPLVNASRSIRLTATEYLPALTNALLEAALHETEVVTRSAEELQALIAKWEALKT